jgi:aspartate/methionine/tyrosine aminotransferase
MCERSPRTVEFRWIRVVAASGTSMANFIAMAALIERGDEVVIEYPVYEPC